jgi:hypothetical protein
MDAGDRYVTRPPPPNLVRDAGDVWTGKVLNNKVTKDRVAVQCWLRRCGLFPRIEVFLNCRFSRKFRLPRARLCRLARDAG